MSNKYGTGLQVCAGVKGVSSVDVAVHLSVGFR